MNKKTQERLKSASVPFHQRMIRYNYDLPIGALRRAFHIVFDTLIAAFEFGIVIKSADRVELDNSYDYDCIVMKKNQIYDAVKDDNRFYRFVKDVHTDGEKLGITDDGCNFYLRLYAWDKENVAENEILSGNIEIYVCDEVLTTIADKLQSETPGHLIVDGAKKYLDEIM